jgi:hypothetical protein
VQMRFENTGERHRIGMRPVVRRSGTPHPPCRRPPGYPGDPADWRGGFLPTLAGQGSGAAPTGRLPPGIPGRRGGRAQGWGDWEGSLTGALGRIDLAGVMAWRAPTGARHLCT